MMPLFKDKISKAMKLMQLFDQSLCIIHPTDEEAQRYYSSEEFPALFVHLRNHMSFKDQRNFNSGTMNKRSRKIIVTIKIGTKEEPKELLSSAQIDLNSTDVNIDFQPLQEYNHGERLYLINYPTWSNPDQTCKSLRTHLIKFEKHMVKTRPKFIQRVFMDNPSPDSQ